MYKLRYFGIPLEGPIDVFCNKMSVVKTPSIPTSALNKRHNSICYHRIREAQAASILWVGWIQGEFNLEDLFTKTTMHGNKRNNLVDSIFSNTSSAIGDIEKVWVHLYICASKYSPH